VKIQTEGQRERERERGEREREREREVETNSEEKNNSAIYLNVFWTFILSSRSLCIQQPLDTGQRTYQAFCIIYRIIYNYIQSLS
jgi:hypothetical protein